MRRRLALTMLATLTLTAACTAEDEPGAPSVAAREPSAEAAGPAALATARVPWEGGPSYYARFAKVKAAGWDDPKFFPLGVWYEGVHSSEDVAKDKAAGLNTYVMVTGDSNMDLIEQGGMHAM